MSVFSFISLDNSEEYCLMFSFVLFSYFHFKVKTSTTSEGSLTFEMVVNFISISKQHEYLRNILMVYDIFKKETETWTYHVEKITN